jgi:hypothetical protein
VGKPEGKRPLGRPMFMWENNIKLGFDEKEWCGLDCCGSGYGAVEGCCVSGNELSGSMKSGEFLV